MSERLQKYESFKKLLNYLLLQIKLVKMMKNKKLKFMFTNVVMMLKVEY